MIKLKDVVYQLEQWAPLSLQESYDNSGWICGDPQVEVEGVVITLDCIEETVMEAAQLGANLIVCHHPLIFQGIKKFTGNSYVERTLVLAIQHRIAIYAIHTNLDNIKGGISRMIGEKLGIKNINVLRPLQNLLKLSINVPTNEVRNLEEALFKVGAGRIGNYADCSFNWVGEGSFTPKELASPALGNIERREIYSEAKLEVLVSRDRQREVHQAMLNAHPFEEIAHEWIPLMNKNQDVGSGAWGDLAEEMEIVPFLMELKSKFNLKFVKHTPLRLKKVKRIAWCGGSGDFLLEDAKAAGADVFLTSDIKYHRFFDHDNRIIIVDLGHFESEIGFVDFLSHWLAEKFTNFAIHQTRVNTNPVEYF